VLVAHDEPGIVDLLRGLIEAQALSVECHDLLDDALERIATDEIDVVVTAWDQPLGAELYRRVLEQQRERRHRFVFVIEEIPEKLAEAAARGRVVRLDDLPGLLAAIEGRLRRRPARPRLLLADDDPDQLAAFADLLSIHGFDITTVDGGNAAIERLERASFDVVLSDWSMTEGSGATLHAWIAANRPDLLGTLVFLTGGDVMEVRARVGSVPVMPKGQDSPPLLALLRASIVEARLARGTPAHGTRMVSAADATVQLPPAKPLPPIPAPPSFELAGEPDQSKSQCVPV
jgi:CheY-like chemotaxis protein